MRSLKEIIEGILADLGFRNLQYLWFKYREVNGERVFGPANGAIWWQITVRQIGSGHVPITVVFQDGSWVRMNLSCEPLYGELFFLILAGEMVWMLMQTTRLRTLQAAVEHRTPGPDRKQCTDVSLVLDAHCFSWLSIEKVCIIQQRALVATLVA